MSDSRQTRPQRNDPKGRIAEVLQPYRSSVNTGAETPPRAV
jgi:hypothetical protein